VVAGQINSSGKWNINTQFQLYYVVVFLILLDFIIN
jgi:hypothetical protein